ncbi:ester cyclase [Micromonospora sp. NPDC050686]|uniref:nuclear transport factor 2 family protein n=1 Tax=Micromonospora sp. NPDC050686 TaxID=3154631 RepID=UPI0033C6D4FA
MAPVGTASSPLLRGATGNLQRPVRTPRKLREVRPIPEEYEWRRVASEWEDHVNDLRVFGEQLRTLLSGLLGFGDPGAPERNTRLIHQIFEWYNQGDLDSIVESVTDDFELHDVPAGEIYRGPDGLRRWFSISKTALPEARLFITNLVAAGDKVASEHAGGGLQTGPLEVPGGTIPPTNRLVKAEVAETFEFRDGRIFRWRVYYDGAALASQLLGATAGGPTGSTGSTPDGTGPGTGPASGGAGPSGGAEATRPASGGAAARD